MAYNDSYSGPILRRGYESDSGSYRSSLPTSATGRGLCQLCLLLGLYYFYIIRVVRMFYLWSSLAVLLCVSGASAFLVGTKLPATAQAQPRNMCTPLEAVPFKVSQCLCACLHMTVNAC